MPKELWQRAFRILWNNYIRNARKRNIFWGLTEDEFLKITTSHCEYCGRKPFQRVWTQDPSRTFIYNGIDRKDNKQGYTRENALPACGECNGIKGHLLTYDEMKAVIHALLEFRKNRRKKP